MITFTIVLFILIISFILLYKMQSTKTTYTSQPTQERKIEFKAEYVPSTNQTEEQKKDFQEVEKKYPKWYGEGNTKGKCFESERIEPLANNQTELVRYKTDRYADLFGRGKDCSYFPGYGKIYNRTFDIWFHETNSTEKKGAIEYRDIGCDKYQPPFFTDRITNGISIYNELERTKGYLKLYNGRDEKNRKTWYAGLKDLEFTGIITDRELEN